MNHIYLENILTSQELEARGISRTQVRTLTQRGTLKRLARGVYAYQEFLLSLKKHQHPMVQLMIEVKSMKFPVLSHESAALWWGAPLISAPGKMHFSVSNDYNVRKKNVVIHRNRETICREAVLYSGLHTTTPTQVVSDCINTLPPIDTLSIANYFLRKEACTFDSLHQALLEPRRYHRRRALQVLDQLNPLCESPLETMVWSLICDWGISKPEQQVWFDLGYGKSGRVDFLWRSAQVILEADGLFKYDGTFGSPEEAIRQERARQRALERMGWTVVRVEWSEIVNSPWALRERLRRAGVQ